MDGGWLKIGAGSPMRGSAEGIGPKQQMVATVQALGMRKAAVAVSWLCFPDGMNQIWNQALHFCLLIVNLLFFYFP